MAVLEPKAEPKLASPLPRQILLVGVTALIVARPLVLGEDPGLLNRPMSDPAGLMLSLLWLVLAVGWAIWRMASQQGTWYASAVDLGLAAVVGLVLLSAHFAAPYKHPAWLIAWEWVVLLVVFCLVRQLATTPEDRRGLLAVLLATGVILSAQALYQFAVVLPQNRELGDNPARLQQVLAGKGIFLQADDPQTMYWRQRLQMDHVYATYAHPNSFAGLLALLLPIGVGWAVVAWKRYRGTWWPIAVTACVVLLAVALWLTHSRGGILAVLLVGAAVALVRWRHLWLAHRGRVLAAVAGVAAVAVLLVWTVRESQGVARLARESLEKRLEYWAGAWRMIRDPAHAGHFWLGVGPGNFGRLYPRYMAADAVEKIQDPHNFALEMWAACGLFAVAALLVAVAIFFRQTRAAWTAADPAPSDETAALGAPRWEFYVGGMLGLVLAFVLRIMGGVTSDEILVEAATSGLGSLLWFAAFALFESIPWPGPSQMLALVAGVAALLLNLCVSGGLFFPSVAQPLWIVMALALAPLSALRPARGWLATALFLVLVAVACGLYFCFDFYPVMASNSHLDDARIGEKLWFEKVEPEWHQALRAARAPADQLQATARAGRLLEELILKPLDAAANADNLDSYTLVQLAYWNGRYWRLFAELNQFANNQSHFEVRKQQREYAERALSQVEQAHKLDPDGLEAYTVDYQLLSLFAEVPGFTPQERNVKYAGIVSILRKMLQIDPHDAQLRYALADYLFRLHDDVAGRREARLAQARDQVLSEHHGRGLTDQQRKQIETWLSSDRADDR